MKLQYSSFHAPNSKINSQLFRSCHSQPWWFLQYLRLWPLIHILGRFGHFHVLRKQPRQCLFFATTSRWRCKSRFGKSSQNSWKVSRTKQLPSRQRWCSQWRIEGQVDHRPKIPDCIATDDEDWEPPVWHAWDEWDQKVNAQEDWTWHNTLKYKAKKGQFDDHEKVYKKKSKKRRHYLLSQTRWPSLRGLRQLKKP